MKKNEIPVNTSSNPPVRKKSELQSRKDLLLQEYRLKMLHNSSDDHINSNDPIITSDKCSVLAIAEKILAEKTSNEKELDKRIEKSFFRTKSIFKEKVKRAIHTIDWILDNVLEMTPEQFYEHFTMTYIKEHRLHRLVLYIVDLAPTEIKIRGSFSIKNVFFRASWPKRFDNEQYMIPGRDIFYCDEDYIESILKTFDSNNTHKYSWIKRYEGSIQTLLYNTIAEVLFEDMNLVSAKEAMDFLTEESALYYGDIKSDSRKPAGINKIIESLSPNCYLSDFFYLNLDVEIRRTWFKYYYAAYKRIHDTSSADEFCERVNNIGESLDYIKRYKALLARS